MTSAAARMRAYRARQKAGLMVFPVEADWVPIAEMLIDNGLLPAGSADDRVAIEPWGVVYKRKCKNV